MTTVLAVTAGLAAGAPARAQAFTSDSKITMTMSWREATSTGGTIPNPDGVLEPGESALVLIDSVSFTNQGGIAHVSPPIGTFTSGVISGFGFGYVDIDGSGGTQGAFNNSIPLANTAGTSGFGIRGAWRLSGNGTVTGTGIADLQFGQFPAMIGNSENPILNMFRMLWTPASYSPRQVAFSIGPSGHLPGVTASVLIDFEGVTTADIAVVGSNLNLGNVSIPIVPAAPTLALAALSLLIGSWPRRIASGSPP
jgi:hypothetical protein